MKLKTKLILAFMIVMILPTLFTTVAMTAFAPKAVNDIQELYLIIVFCTLSVGIPERKREAFLSAECRRNRMLRQNRP